MSCPVKFDLHHVSFYVSNLDKSIAWYERLFGFKLMDRMVVDQGGTEAEVAFIKCGALRLSLYQYDNLNPFSFEELNKIVGTKFLALRVADDDFEDMKKHLETQEAKIMLVGQPEEITGKKGGVRVILLFDPDGIPIQIFDDYKPGE